ncbi:MAG TPA: hypothetical protein VHI11_05410 [Jiangellaceae bacterium]|nr:hypothetical protein [Jiangellaceae bacterium]
MSSNTWGMGEELSGADLAAALAGVDVGSLDADAALGYALAAARLGGGRGGGRAGPAAAVVSDVRVGGRCADAPAGC